MKTTKSVYRLAALFCVAALACACVLPVIDLGKTAELVQQAERAGGSMTVHLLMPDYDHLATATRAIHPHSAQLMVHLRQSGSSGEWLLHSPIPTPLQYGPPDYDVNGAGTAGAVVYGFPTGVTYDVLAQLLDDAGRLASLRRALRST